MSLLFFLQDQTEQETKQQEALLGTGNHLQKTSSWWAI